ncbi:MAG: hypothetical protein JSR61_13210 [Proteobacteria bacterium]|nr:hypothetical protein [Pseudomonadota bacterium]
MSALYAGQTAVLATMHGKEKAVGPAFSSRLEVTVVVPDMFDTDLLGTFTGEIPRFGTIEDAAMAKARAAMKQTGLSLGIASEGSYGPHPLVPFIAAGIELMVFVDDERGVVVKETFIDEAPVFAHIMASKDEDIIDFLSRVDFPRHALISSPAQPVVCAQTFHKGLKTKEALAEALAASCAMSKDGRALVQTDMRAHMNPTRMKALEALAERLVGRIASQCPSCAAPGFGIIGTEKGLPCEYCGGPSVLVRHELLGCISCNHKETRPRQDGLATAEQRYCTGCNP